MRHRGMSRPGASSSLDPTGEARQPLLARTLWWAFGPKLSWYFTIPTFILLLVAGIVLILLGSRYVAASLRNDALAEAGRDVEWEAAMLGKSFSRDQLTTTAQGSQYAEIDHFVRGHLQHPGIRRVKIWSPGGQVLYSDEPSLVGETFTVG